MSQSRQATVCLLANHSVDDFRRALASVLTHTPADCIELRLAFSHAPDSLAYAVGALAPDGVCPKRAELPDGVERFEWAGTQGQCIRAWSTSQRLGRAQFARLIDGDLPIESEYAIFRDPGTAVAAGWWEALVPLFAERIDYIGRPAWRDYLQGEVAELHTFGWYMGVPPARREGRPGVSYMADGLLAIRTECLRQIDFPVSRLGTRSEVLLGAAVHQLQWTQAAHNSPLQPRDA